MNKSLTLDEARGRSAAISDVAYRIRLDLTDPARFRSTTRVSFRCAVPGGSTFVELSNAEQISVSVPASYADGRVHLENLAEHNEIEIDAWLPYVTTGDGLHLFVDPADGQRYVAAYVGMDVARRIFACFDQPDLKATIQLSVIAPTSWTVLANGIGATTPHGQGAVEWSFTPTPPIATYLFAVCAGPWYSRQFEHDGKPFGWHARASMAHLLDRDFDDLRRQTTQAFDYYQGVFDEPYPFDSYDQVMVPEHNWGAMESPGCVTFRDEMLTPGAPSPAETLWRNCVIAHEMAHQWFGNLVTMQWWEDSWLNESFADYMGYSVAAITGTDGTWAAVGVDRKVHGYLADLRRSSHPIAEDTENVRDAETAFANFDMITYAKGNAVLAQLVHWLGEEEFFAGVNLYFARHKWSNATLNDFLSALDEVTDRDVHSWAKSWLKSIGFDTLVVSRDGDTPVLSRAGSRPHKVSVAGWQQTDSGWEYVKSELVEVDAEPVRLDHFDGLAVIPNAADETFATISVSADPRSRGFADHAVSRSPDPVTRSMLWWNSTHALRQGMLSAGAYRELVAEHLAREQHPMLFDGVLQLIATVAQPVLDPAESSAICRTLAQLTRTRLDHPQLARTAVKHLVTLHSDLDELNAWLGAGSIEGHGLDPGLRWRLVRRIVELGGDPTIIDREAAGDHSAYGVLAARTASAAVPTPEAKAAAWAELFEPNLSNRSFDHISQGFWSTGHHELVTPYLTRYVEEMPAVAKARPGGFEKVIGRSFPMLPLPTASLRTLAESLSGRLAQPLPTVLGRQWSDKLDEVKVALALRS